MMKFLIWMFSIFAGLSMIIVVLMILLNISMLLIDGYEAYEIFELGAGCAFFTR